MPSSRHSAIAAVRVSLKVSRLVSDRHLVEVALDGEVNRGEFLQTSHAPETLHRTFSSLKREVRAFNAIVEPLVRSLFFERPQLAKCSRVGCKTIRHDLFGKTMLLHQFLKEFECCSFVSALRDHSLEHFTFVTHHAPEVVSLAIHLHKNLVHVPLPF